MCAEKESRPAPDCTSVPLEKLVQPAILLLLARNAAHGYELIQKLSSMECVDYDPDTATVYRTLRKMEQDGLVLSNWEHGEFGPARRQYRLSEGGRKLLDLWAKGLEARMRQIESFLTDYKGLSGESISEAVSRKAGVTPNDG